MCCSLAVTICISFALSSDTKIFVSALACRVCNLRNQYVFRCCIKIARKGDLDFEQM